MKAGISMAVIGTLAGCLAGPTILYLAMGTPQEFAQRAASAKVSPDNRVSLWVDKGTGCEYLVSGGSIIQRLDGEGYPICPGAVDEGMPPLVPPAWEGGSDESPIYDGVDDQPLRKGMEIPGFIWVWSSQMWVRPAADDVEDTATLARPGPVFTL